MLAPTQREPKPEQELGAAVIVICIIAAFPLVLFALALVQPAWRVVLVGVVERASMPRMAVV